MKRGRRLRLPGNCANPSIERSRTGCRRATRRPPEKNRGSPLTCREGNGCAEPHTPPWCLAAVCIIRAEFPNELVWFFPGHLGGPPFGTPARMHNNKNLQNISRRTDPRSGIEFDEAAGRWVSRYLDMIQGRNTKLVPIRSVRVNTRRSMTHLFLYGPTPITVSRSRILKDNWRGRQNAG